jgi:hypothetical protein
MSSTYRFLCLAHDPAIEIYDPRTRHWIDVDTVRLVTAARAVEVTGAVLEPFTRRGWDADTFGRLRHYLGE